MKPRKNSVRFYKRSVLVSTTLFMSMAYVHASSLTWDGNGATAPNPNGGTGTWDVNATSNWWDGASNAVWPAAGGSDDDAVFANTAGTVSLAVGGAIANDVNFTTTGYVIQSNALTLNGTTPTITTGTGVSATINSTVSGSAGLLKTGPGTLTLGGANNYTGGTVISQGTLISSAGTSLGTSAITLGDGSTGSNNVRLQFNASALAGQIGIMTVVNTGSSGTATVAVNNGVNNANVGSLVLNRATVFAGLGTTANNQLIRGNVSGPGAGAGNDTLIVDSGSGNALTMYVGPTDQNTYTGNLRIKTGTLQLGNRTNVANTAANQNLCIPDTASVTVDTGAALRFVWTGLETIDALNGGGTLERNTGDGQNVTLTVGASNGSGSFNGTHNVSIAILKTGTGTQEFSGNGISYTAATTLSKGTLKLSNTSAWGSNITLDAANTTTFQLNAPLVTDSWTFAKTLAGGSAAATIEKTGLGAVTLTQAVPISGVTQVTAGILQISGSGSLANSTVIDVKASATLSGNPVTISSGHKLQGSGTANTALTVASGATFAPGGTGAIGTFTANSSLALAGSTIFEINKTGSILTGDSVAGTASVSLGGNLTVTATGEPLALGDTLTLFSNTGGLTGTFTSFSLPALPPGLSWDRTNLPFNGTITVVDAVGAPLFTPPAGGYLGAQSVSISSDSGSTIHYTTDGSDPVTSGTVITGMSPVTGVVVPDNSPNFIIQAYATKGGQSDSPVSSSSYQTVTTPTWNIDNIGLWSDSSSWLNGVIPDGIGIPADFNATPQGGDTAITVNGNRTVGSLIFGNINPINWSLESLDNSILTLAMTSGSPTVTVNNNTATLRVTLAGTQGLTKAGLGTLVLASSNTITGGITVNEGTLQVATGGSLGTGAVVVNAALVYSQSAINVSNAISGTGTVSGTTAGTLTIGKNITLTDNNITLSSSGAATLSTGTSLSVGKGTGSISATPASGSGFIIGGTSSLAATGGGSLSLSGVTTTTGGGASGLVLSGANLTTSGTISLSGQNSGEWGINFGASATIHATSGTTTLTGTTTGANTTKGPFLFITDPTITLTADPGAAIVLKGGTGTGANNHVFYDYTLGSTFNVSGDISFIAGTTASGSVFWTNKASLFHVAANSALTLNAQGTVVNHGIKIGSMGANSTVTYAASSSGATMTGTQALTTSTSSVVYNISGSGTLTQSGVISGAGSLSKIGTGTLTLSGTQTYSGATDVNGGTMVITGMVPSSSAVNVASTATLRGAGSLTGPLTVQSGGIVAPGGSAVGTLSVGAATLNGTYTCRINGAASDAIAVSGDLTIGAESTIVLSQVNPPTAASYTIATYTGTLNGTPVVNGIPSGYALDTTTAGQIKLVSNNPYTIWAANFPPETDATPLGDPDHDGIVNLIEFVTNGDPTVSSGANLPTASAEGSSLVFTFILRNDAAALNPTVEFSTSLDSGTWTTAEHGSNSSIDSVDNGDNTHTVTVTIPKGSEAKLFARLKVTTAP